MKSQVLNIEQVQELIDLGIDISKASCTWCKVRAITSDRKGYSWMILPETLNKFDEEHVPTFTLQDILEILPKYITVDEYEYKWNIMPFGEEYVAQYLDTDCINPALVTVKDESLLTACFNMLKWCKQNNMLIVDGIN